MVFFRENLIAINEIFSEETSMREPVLVREKDESWRRISFYIREQVYVKFTLRKRGKLREIWSEGKIVNLRDIYLEKE
jgi:hypothetical protein